VRCNYCLKTFKGQVFIFKHHLVGTGYDSEHCVLVPKDFVVTTHFHQRVFLGQIPRSCRQVEYFFLISK